MFVALIGLTVPVMRLATSDPPLCSSQINGIRAENNGVHNTCNLHHQLLEHSEP